MKKYRPKLDPQVDLKGATPETLAKALLTPRVRGKPVVRRESSVEKVATDKPGDSITHLGKSV
ncbi:MAG: hypothetical protein OXI60_04925 [Acidiferrobacterales bacterium]|nr:hypothetical protein [Acidiferrobacterales bacterium]